MRFLHRLLKIALLLAFVLLGGYLGLYNQERVGMSFPPLIEHLSLPSYVAFLAFFALGILAASLYFSIDGLRKTFEIRRLAKQIRALGGTPVTAGNRAGGEPEIGELKDIR